MAVNVADQVVHRSPLDLLRYGCELLQCGLQVVGDLLSQHVRIGQIIRTVFVAF
jgi:hypothetical protein